MMMPSKHKRKFVKKWSKREREKERQRGRRERVKRRDAGCCRMPFCKCHSCDEMWNIWQTAAVKSRGGVTGQSSTPISKPISVRVLTESSRDKDLWERIFNEKRDVKISRIPEKMHPEQTGNRKPIFSLSWRVIMKEATRSCLAKCSTICHQIWTLPRCSGHVGITMQTGKRYNFATSTTVSKVPISGSMPLWRKKYLM